MPALIECPKCGFKQPFTRVCRNCLVNISRYVEFRKRIGEPAELPKIKISPEAAPDLHGEPHADAQAEPVVHKMNFAPLEAVKRASAERRAEPELHGTWDVLVEAFGGFRERYGVLYALFFIAAASVAVPPLTLWWLAIFIARYLPDYHTPLVASLSALGLFAGIAFGLRPVAAFLRAVDDDALDVSQALDAAMEGRFRMAGALIAYIAVTGLGLLGFIAPGLVFFSWFAFAPFIAVREGRGVFESLVRSRAYQGVNAWRAAIGVYAPVPFIAFMCLWPVVGLRFFLPLMIVPYIYYLNLLYKNYYDFSDGRPYTESGAWAMARWPLAALGSAVLFMVAMTALRGPVFLSESGQRVLSLVPRLYSDRGVVTEIEGVWIGTETGGRSGWVVVASLNKIEIMMPMGEKSYKGRFRLVRGSVPRGIDIDVTLAPDTRMVGKVIKGIYSLDGENVMSLCTGIPGAPDRPEDFSAQGDYRCFNLTKTDLSPDEVRLQNIASAELRITGRSFNRGEPVRVEFFAPKVFHKYAWVGIVPSDVPHGSEEVNQKKALAIAFINGLTHGYLDFTMPKKPGRYDFRMHDADHLGNEVFHLPVEVVGSKISYDEIKREGTPADDYYLQVISYNYTVQVFLNGSLAKIIPSKPDWRFESTTDPGVKLGRNTVRVVYYALNDSAKKRTLTVRLVRVDRKTMFKRTAGIFSPVNAEGDHEMEIFVK